MRETTVARTTFEGGSSGFAPVKKKGRPRKDAGVEVDHRTILSLLPGKLIIRREIAKELAIVRQGVQSGARREWIALLPGLEMEYQRVEHDLEQMGELVGGYFSFEQSGAESNAEPRPERLPVERQLEPAAGVERSSKSDGVDIASVFGRMTVVGGRPVMHALILQQLIRTPSMDRKAFIEKWKADYPSIAATSGISTSLKKLREAGIKVVCKHGGPIVIRTKVFGEFPPEIAEHPLFVNGPGHSAPQPQQTPKADKPSKPSKSSPRPHTESQAHVLIREFRSAPNRTLNFNDLEKKYNAKKYSFNWAINNLKTHHGLVYRQVAPATFQLIKEGTTPAFRKGTLTEK